MAIYVKTEGMWGWEEKGRVVLSSMAEMQTRKDESRDYSQKDQVNALPSRLRSKQGSESNVRKEILLYFWSEN